MQPHTHTYLALPNRRGTVNRLSAAGPGMATAATGHLLMTGGPGGSFLSSLRSTLPAGGAASDYDFTRGASTLVMYDNGYISARLIRARLLHYMICR